MTNRDTSKYSVLKLEELIKSYVNSKNNSAAKIELSDMIIDGEDLVDALDNLGFESDKEMEEYEQVKADYKEESEKRKEMIDEIRNILGTKKGTLIDKINEILDNYKVVP